MTCARRIMAAIRRLRDARRGIALIEFALLLPTFTVLCLLGAEITHYITTKMRVSQIALQISDDAARIGSGTRLSAKKITEADINDLFTGAQLQSGGLDLRANGRVVLSSLEPVANPNTTNRYKITWQRCFGTKTAYDATRTAPAYPAAGATNLTGMGPAGRQAFAQDDNATMFVEVYYVYKPLIGSTAFSPPAYSMMEIASMAVRDRRDLSDDSAAGAAATHPKGIYKVSGVTASTC